MFLFTLQQASAAWLVIRTLAKGEQNETDILERLTHGSSYSFTSTEWDVRRNDHLCGDSILLLLQN